MGEQAEDSEILRRQQVIERLVTTALGVDEIIWW
jgi:hypothetical protein